MGNASICWEFITVVSYQYVEEWQWRKCCNHRFPRVKHFLLIENKKLINQFEIWIWTRKTEVLVFVKQNTQTRVREKNEILKTWCDGCVTRVPYYRVEEWRRTLVDEDTTVLWAKLL